MAGATRLWLGDRVLVVAALAQQRGDDWLFACGGDGHAVCRGAYRCHELHRYRAGSCPQLRYTDSSANYVGSFAGTRIFLRARGACERPGGADSFRGRGIAVDSCHEALAQGVAVPSSQRDCSFLRDGFALVCCVRAAQSGFLAGLFPGAQFQAVSDAAIPTYPALLVLRGSGSRRVSSMDGAAALLCWIFFCVAFFTISKSKLPGYILPALPAIGLLLARSYTRISPEQSALFRRTMIAASAVLGVVSVLLSTMLGHLHTSRITAQAARSAAWIIL